MTKTYAVVTTLFLALFNSSALIADALSFNASKEHMREQVYQDRTKTSDGTFYCGCSWSWAGASGGRIDHDDCGYGARKQKNRAARLEWEHVVPAWVMGHQRQCWQEGGRRNCRSDDPVFSAMEADMHNLVPSIGEVNGDRSNYQFGILPGEPRVYGQCDFEVDFEQRTVEPRPEVRGQIARTYFYIHDRYGLNMSNQQQRLFMAWDKAHPVTAWERQRDQRIAKVMGHHNAFVTGERSWQIGQKNSAEGLISWLASGPIKRQSDLDTAEVRGNRNSMVYHLPEGCPSYDRMSPQNRVPLASEAEAKADGYRKAGNCR
jgi:deoxyribonuclease-1